MTKTNMPVIIITSLATIVTLLGCGACKKEKIVPEPAITITATTSQTSTPVPTELPETTVTLMPTAPIVPTVTSIPTETPKPTEQALPTATQAPTSTPIPSVTDIPTTTPTPTVTPKPTSTPMPTPTALPSPTETPVPTTTPKPIATPTPTPLTVMVEKDEFVAEVEKILGYNEEDLLQQGIAFPKGEIYRTEAFEILQKLCVMEGLQNEELVKVIKNKERLSDIGSLDYTAREAAYSLYALGIIEGTSDGEYTRTRSMKGMEKLNKEDFILYLNRIKNSSLRRVLSPDGQMTRTTNLPSYAKYYPYILEDFPNEFYDAKFDFECMRNFYDKKEIYYTPQDSGKDKYKDKLFVPVDFKAYCENSSDKYIHEDYSDWEQVKDDINDTLEQYLKNAYNVDYQTVSVDSEWAKNVFGLRRSWGFPYEPESEFFSLDQTEKEYMEILQNNKVHLECDYAKVDMSTLHGFQSDYYIRACIHYRVLSAEEGYYTFGGQDNANSQVTKDTIKEWRTEYINVHIGFKEELNPIQLLDFFCFSGYR